MKEETIQKRSQDTIRLLDYGFSLLKAETIFHKDEVILNYEFKNILKKNIGIMVKKDIIIILYKEENKDDLKYDIELYVEEPPFNIDQPIGNLVITSPKGNKYYYEVYPCESVNKLSFWDYILHNLKLFFLC